ncbi:hypothetical protein Tco_0559076 [Tanacetum coccineum]
METKDTLSSCSNSEEQQIQDKAKESCMVSFQQLQSHLKLLSNNDLKGTRIESGFKHVFTKLFGQDVETFTCTMFLNVEQLEKKLDKEEFQEIRSMAAFKKSIDERAMHKREYDTRVNERHRIVSDKGNDQGLENQSNISGDESSRSRNKCNDKSTSRDDTDIRPSYDTEPMVKWKKGDSNVIPDSPNMCDNDIQNDQNVVECDDELI